MVLSFYSSRDNITPKFVNYVLYETRKYLREKIYNAKLSHYDNFLTEYIQRDYVTQKKIPIRAKQILLIAIENLKVVRQGDIYNIVIDPNAKLPGAQIKIATAARMIERGNMSLPAANILTSGMNYISDILPLLYEKYRRSIM